MNPKNLESNSIFIINKQNKRIDSLPNIFRTRSLCIKAGKFSELITDFLTYRSKERSSLHFAPVRMAVLTESLSPYRIMDEQEPLSFSLSVSASVPSPSVEKTNPSDAVIFFGLSLGLGIACRHLLRGTRVPYTVALLILGIALGSIGSLLISPPPLLFLLSLIY